jgi:hypothetical protein
MEKYRTSHDPSGTGILTEMSDDGIDLFLAELETMGDAERIARKLNAHDALVDALKSLVSIAEATHGAQDRVDAARAALKLAEGDDA